MFLVEARTNLLAQSSVLQANEDGQLKILSYVTNVDCFR